MRIREMRRRTNLTGAELARRVGVTAGAVSQWENGTFVPATSKLPAIAAALGCSVDDLYGPDELRFAGEASARRVREKAVADARKMAEQAGEERTLCRK